jgi:galactonate dehydratase
MNTHHDHNDDENSLARRGFLKAGLLGVTTAGLVDVSQPTAAANETVKADKPLQIVRIDRTTVKVPFRKIPARNMARELPHWEYSEIVEVHLQSGHTGFGETMLYYTWGVTTDEDVARARGKNAAELMWDDSFGAGLQMALFDAVARAAEVPIHHLLGHKVHDRTPLSWWNIETSPEDMAAECREAYRQGYMAYKTKGRPWIDVWKQVAASSKVVPKEFKIDLDFNDTLLDAERGIPILKDLAAFPNVDIFETPIPQEDIAGNQAIRNATDVSIAMHYGKPDPLIAIKEEICDGFIIGGGARGIMDGGAVSAMADKPFWLQLVGTGITAAFSLHFGGVLSHARWPAVNCHQLYQHSMLTKPIRVKEGFAEVPDKPGLGFELDRDAVERFRVAKPKQRPEPARLIETRWPDGRLMYIASNGSVNFMLDQSREGNTPYFERGVTTRLVPNDGSPRWQELYNQARKEPLMVNK